MNEGDSRGATPAAILAGVILFPPARELFHFGPLHGDDVVVALAAGLLALLLVEVAKRLVQPFQLIPSSGLSSDEPTAVRGCLGTSTRILSRR